MDSTKFLSALCDGEVDAVRSTLREHPAAIQFTFAEPFNPEGCGGRENRALAIAAYHGHLDILDGLLDAGSDPEHRNADGRTALHVALEYSFAAANHLVARGVAKDVIASACLHDHAVLRSLLDADASLANDRSTQLSALGWATYFGARESAEILFEFGARADDGELLCAAGTANAELARLLLEHGVDVQQRTPPSGPNALHIAAAHEYTKDSADFVQFLLESGADPTEIWVERSMNAIEIARAKLKDQDERQIAKGDDDWRNYEGVIGILESAV